MKRIAKILLASGASLMLAAGSVMTYLQTQRALEPVSDLTLANIEALNFSIDPELIPSAGIPCKHTGNQEDCCTYYIHTSDGTVIPQHDFFCINDPDYRP
ncbi:hypothetical protein [Rikenella microfusus]|uniref:hypothetical protein n=1 Tax=Rikenella microfusus TaxID=28139 RepID=UPI00248DC8C6|nr:hypothetical protein [Rikenella microfusus]